jgi:hypothetical protein
MRPRFPQRPAGIRTEASDDHQNCGMSEDDAIDRQWERLAISFEGTRFHEALCALVVASNGTVLRRFFPRTSMATLQLIDRTEPSAERLIGVEIDFLGAEEFLLHYRRPAGAAPEAALFFVDALEAVRAATSLIDQILAADTPPIEQVLCYFDWYDCPRLGVALFRSQPHYFECRFSEDLDDYPSEFELWPIEPERLERELAVYEVFAQWRAEHDRGAAVPRLAEVPAFVEARSALLAMGDAPRSITTLAVPEWHLDPERRYAKSIPRHRVRWLPADQSAAPQVQL